MATLYIDRKEITLKVSGGAVEFHEPHGRRGSVPLGSLERVVIWGRAQLSTSVIGALTEAGASVLLLGGRHGRRLAICVGRPHNDVLRRLGQFDAYRDAQARQQWSRTIVYSKVKSQSRLLARALDRRSDKRRPLKRALSTLAAAERRVATSATSDPATLLGIEGAAAAAYFGGLAELFPPSLGFVRRNRRPPKDPVNSCLSLGYTLLHFEAVSACHAAGLDPMLGLYHQPAFGRESLAADIIEPYRAHVDEWAWGLFRDRVLVNDGFRKVNGAVVMGKATRRQFYERFNPLGAALRRLLRRHLRPVVRVFQERARMANNDDNITIEGVP